MQGMLISILLVGIMQDTFLARVQPVMRQFGDYACQLF